MYVYLSVNNIPAAHCIRAGLNFCVKKTRENQAVKCATKCAMGFSRMLWKTPHISLLLDVTGHIGL